MTKLPMHHRLVGDLPVGARGYTHVWALHQQPAGTYWVDSLLPIATEPDATFDLLVERTDTGVRVDLRPARCSGVRHWPAPPPQSEDRFLPATLVGAGDRVPLSGEPILRTLRPGEGSEALLPASRPGDDLPDESPLSPINLRPPADTLREASARSLPPTTQELSVAIDVVSWLSLLHPEVATYDLIPALTALGTAQQAQEEATALVAPSRQQLETARRVLDYAGQQGSVGYSLEPFPGLIASRLAEHEKQDRTRASAGQQVSRPAPHAVPVTRLAEPTPLRPLRWVLPAAWYGWSFAVLILTGGRGPGVAVAACSLTVAGLHAIALVSRRPAGAARECPSGYRLEWEIKQVMFYSLSAAGRKLDWECQEALRDYREFGDLRRARRLWNNPAFQYRRLAFRRVLLSRSLPTGLFVGLLWGTAAAPAVAAVVLSGMLLVIGTAEAGPVRRWFNTSDHLNLAGLYAVAICLALLLRGFSGNWFVH